jgi:hypothetical protein
MNRLERGFALGCGFGVFLIAYQAFVLAFNRGAVELWLIAFVLFGCAWGIASHGARVRS